MGDYITRGFPWVSKSKLLSLDYCPYDFYIKRIKKDKEKARKDAIEGTNMHVVFARFFQAIKLKVEKEGNGWLFKDKFTDPRIPIHTHPFREFIYEGCLNFVKPEHRNYGKYKNILRNFATIECRRWLRINSLIHNKVKALDIFTPRHIELNLEYKPYHMYGTIDRINVEVMPDKTLRLAIYDYKTGNVPSSIRSRSPTSSDMFDWELPPYCMKEIHFYGMLFLLNSGWKMTDRIGDFLENDNNWYLTAGEKSYKETLKLKGQILTKMGKDYRLYKNGKTFKTGDILVGYYYLNGEEGYRPLKKYNYASHKTMLKSINDYRSIMYNKHFVKHPRSVFNIEGCSRRNCNRFKSCKALMEAKS